MEQQYQRYPKAATKRPDHIQWWQWDGSDEMARLIVEWVNTHTSYVAEKHPHEELIVLDKTEGLSPPARKNHYVVIDMWRDVFALPPSDFSTRYVVT